jgi:hypothetical protein
MIASALLIGALFTGCYIAPTYYLQNFSAQSLLPCNTVSLTKHKNDPVVEVGGSVTVNDAKTLRFIDSSRFVFSDPEKNVSAYNVRLTNPMYAVNLFSIFTSGKIITVSFENQFGKTGNATYFNCLIGLGARLHSRYIGGSIFTNFGFSNYDFIVSILCEDKNFEPTKYFYLNDRYNEWIPSIGWNVTVNTTKIPFPIGFYFNLKAQCLRLFKYETVHIDYCMISPSIGLFKELNHFTIVSGVNFNIFIKNDDPSFLIKPSCVFQVTMPFYL